MSGLRPRTACWKCPGDVWGVHTRTLLYCTVVPFLAKPDSWSVGRWAIFLTGHAEHALRGPAMWLLFRWPVSVLPLAMASLGFVCCASLLIFVCDTQGFFVLV